MAIRPAQPADATTIADLARARALRHHNCDPATWAGPFGHDNPADAPDQLERRGHDRWHGPDISLVATSGGQRTVDSAPPVLGHVSAHRLPQPDRPGTLWHVDRLEAVSRVPPDPVERAMLAATAAAAHAQGGGQLVIGTPANDTRRGGTLRRAGFTIDCWFRQLDLRDSAPLVAAPPGGTDSGLPLPHIHEFVADLAEAESITTPGGHALVTPTLTTGTLVAPNGRFAVVDPAIANDATSMMLLIDHVEATCRDRFDDMVFVAVGPAEEQLDHVLAARGYRRTVNWWTLHARR